MSEGATGMVLLIVLSVLCAAVAHALIRRPMAAAAGAAVAASLLFQLAVTARLGHVEKFAAIAFVYGWFWAFVVALLVGLLFRLGRRTA